MTTDPRSAGDCLGAEIGIDARSRGERTREEQKQERGEGVVGVDVGSG